ncbi:hypothetical protein ACCO45_008348 [Purpureocillium lilacinum]|uniref:Uncharacterized protein n=1 Tax=Purpureocillium lilacinum TaxID=33203 RepID=A0ACC4DR54_PURLI
MPAARTPVRTVIWPCTLRIRQRRLVCARDVLARFEFQVPRCSRRSGAAVPPEQGSLPLKRLLLCSLLGHPASPASFDPRQHFKRASSVAGCCHSSRGGTEYLFPGLTDPLAQRIGSGYSMFLVPPALPAQYSWYPQRANCDGVADAPASVTFSTEPDFPPASHPLPPPMQHQCGALHAPVTCQPHALFHLLESRALRRGETRRKLIEPADSKTRQYSHRVEGLVRQPPQPKPWFVQAGWSRPRRCPPPPAHGEREEKMQILTPGPKLDSGNDIDRPLRDQRAHDDDEDDEGVAVWWGVGLGCAAANPDRANLEGPFALADGCLLAGPRPPQQQRANVDMGTPGVAVSSRRTRGGGDQITETPGSFHAAGSKLSSRPFLPPPPPPPPPPRPPCLVWGHPRADKPQAQRTGPEGRDPGRSRPALAASRPTSAHAPSGAPPSKWVPVVGMLGQRLAGLLAGRDTETPACARFFFIPSIFQQGCLMDGLMGTDAPGLLCCGPYAFSSPPSSPPTITDEQQQLLPFQAFMPLSQPALAEAPGPSGSGPAGIEAPTPCAAPGPP